MIYRYNRRICFTLISIFIIYSCKSENKQSVAKNNTTTISQNSEYKEYLVSDTTISIGLRVASAAESINDPSIVYDPSYRTITYPMGDVDPKTGVCTDVVIRTYRKLGTDLQQLVHEDMKANFALYPSQKMWGLKSTDKNIDHRRVPNLQRFFERKGKIKSIKSIASDYTAGDIVAWRLPNGLLHIGILINKKSKDGIPLVMHNIGRGQIAENVLFAWDIIGHYSYSPR